MSDICAIEGVPVIQLVGPLVLGYQFNWALFGVLSVQMYIYHQARMPDGRFVKTLVYGLYLLETVQTVLATHDAWHEIALSWGNCLGLLGLYWAWLSQPVISGIASATIQCFYAWRIRVLSKSTPLAMFIAAIALMQGSAAIAEGVSVLVTQNVPGTQVDTFKITTVWLGGTAACDVIIASLMVYFLSRSRTGFRSTDSVLNKLIRIIVETGMATAIVAIIELSMFLSFKHNFYHIVPSLMLSKLYSNSLLVLLNNRLTISYRRDSEFTGSEISGRSRGEVETQRSRGGGMIQVTIDRETYNENIAMVKLQDQRSQMEEGSGSSKLHADDLA